ncbi:aspartate-semialdehyde dehydrogenase [Anaerocaecibacter muris]|uniref:aspartate-semialdehyde dehydrogenase n=1 Tax=Anaerocaecibacter muris TaxID=2941513 RepID=UPI003F68FAB4
MNVTTAVVGATGLVGRMMLKVLEERNFPVGELHLFASARSAGAIMEFKGKKYTVEELTAENIKKANVKYAIFSAGGDVSKQFAPIFASCGAVAIDNSSYWRMDKNVPLVVPEVNPEAAFKHNGIIANPNCSTIQAVVALKPLHDAFKIKRIVYSTYQAVSGAGRQGYDDLQNGINGEPPKKFPHPIAFNVLPHIDVFTDDGYTKEELKMVNETRKILGDDAMRITATTARVPVYYGHSESINIEFYNPVTRAAALDVLRQAKGIVVCDDPANNVYPMPIDSEGHDEVFVGRVREDHSVDNGLNIWVVADNIRKGAASNAVQIAELLYGNGY